MHETISVGPPVDDVTKKTKMKVSNAMKPAVILALGLAIGTATALATGNGAQSGSHFNLNIIGKAQCPTDDKSSGNVIFVLLNGGDSASSLNGKLASTVSKVNKIYLTQSPDNTTFEVLDGNA